MTIKPCSLAATLLVLITLLASCATTTDDQPLIPFTMDSGAECELMARDDRTSHQQSYALRS